MTRSEQIDRAFNRGCDARIAGFAITANPYTTGDMGLMRAWKSGWRDAHRSWGAEYLDADALPEVREDAA